MKYFYNLFMVLFLGLSLLLSCTEKETTVEVSSVSLNTATIEMVEGETFNLVATVLPKDAEYDGVTWASSNVSVASVQSGTVTALKEGTATITASAGGKSSTCNVRVVVPVTGVTLDKTILFMVVGETATLTATVKPENATDKTVIWKSSDELVANVINGTVSAIKGGNVRVEASLAGFSIYCDVSVCDSSEVIYYTSNDKSVVEPNSKNGFFDILSNEYSDGGGRILTAGARDYLPDEFFYKKSNLVSIKLPSEVRGIGTSAFAFCEALETIDLPSTLNGINPDAFRDCPLSNFVLPESVTFIGNGAFMNTKFKTIDLPKGLNNIGEGSFYGSGLTKVIIPGSVALIELSAFAESKNLVYVEVEEGVSSLPWHCFYGCTALSIVSLPSSITAISDSVFDDCPMLENLYLKAVLPPTLYDGIFDANTSVTIWVPRTSVDAYKSAKGWSKYKDNIKGYDY